MPPWPSGLVAIRPGASSSTRPVWASTAGMVPWQKTIRSSSGSPKRSCAAKKATVSSWVAGLVIRYSGIRTPYAPAGGHDLLDVDLEQRFARERPDGEHALGMIEPQAGSLSSGHEDRAELSGAERLLGALAVPVAA